MHAGGNEHIWNKGICSSDKYGSTVLEFSSVLTAEGCNLTQVLAGGCTFRPYLEARKTSKTLRGTADIYISMGTAGTDARSASTQPGWGIRARVGPP